MIHKKIISFLEEKYPVRFSERWDKTSLQVGSLQDETKAILFALDPSIELVDYAIRNNYNTIKYWQRSLKIKEELRYKSVIAKK
jgi:putative NIF3 family GTP cyclohydrolase 1 type 2